MSFSAKISRDFFAFTASPACAVFLYATLSLPAAGQSVGLIGGIIRDLASGKSGAEAQIVAHNLNDSADRSAVPDAVEPPLTQREKRLLDRIERLESRLAAVETATLGTTPTASRN